MSKRRKNTGVIFSLLFFAVICLGVCLVIGAYFELNRRTEVLYGPPTVNLSPLDRLRLSSQLFFSTDQLLEPVDKYGESTQFEIPLGESPQRIAARLRDAGLIHDSQAFITYLRYSGLDRTIQAGKYSLSPSISPIALAQILQDATPGEITLSILPGWRLEEIAATLPTSGLDITEEQFLSAAHSSPKNSPIPSEVLRGNSVEGFLSPGSYRLDRQTNATQLINFLLDQFISNQSNELTNGFQSQGLDLYEAVALASIVEREAIVADEMPLIASVFLNRLAIGMPLEADSTAQYAVGFNQSQNTWWTNPLSEHDLRFDSPYNTYLYPSLPPGPIANPSSSALRAVAFPAQTPYYYFRAACDDTGKHSFSETFEEHLSKQCP
jgi:UPF0755 protein